MNDYITSALARSDFAYCKQFIFSFGSNYALGVRLFPKSIQRATIIFYAFVRYVDEIVDNPDQSIPGQTHASVDDFIRAWEQVMNHEPDENTHPVIRANYYLFLEYQIPFSYLDDFLVAMKQDMTKKRYHQYAELEHYMWGSATIVGHVMTYFVGYYDAAAFGDARALAEAMQLANFLRDVNEDYVDRDRIYLPLNDMELFGVSESDIVAGEMNDRLRNFIRHYVERTEKLFAQGISGLHFLKKGQFSILLASRMYRENIRILAKRDYDIFGQKIRLSKWHKIGILITTTIMYPFWRLFGSRPVLELEKDMETLTD